MITLEPVIEFLPYLAGMISAWAFLKGYNESVRRNNSFTETPYLSWLGIFVWGDAVVIALFWFVTSSVSIFSSDPVLFMLAASVFWAVRSLGEMIYWFNQQFSTILRNPPEKMKGYRLIRRSSIWFIYQIVWQCLLVVSIIASIYFANLWLRRLNG